VSDQPAPARLQARAGRIRVEVEVHVPPGTGLVEQVNWLATLPQGSPDRHECEGWLYMTLARSAWRRAEDLRRAERDRARRRAARRPETPGE
jgi:hypothetical protein